MLTLFHHPFCPHSRFVRLAFGEFGVTARMVEERVWERRQEFLALNPDCTTPVLVEEGYPAVPGAGIIAEYLDETSGVGAGQAWYAKVNSGPSFGPLLAETLAGIPPSETYADLDF